MYIIRGLARSCIHNIRILHVVVKNTNTGIYTNLKYPMNELTTIDTIFKSVLFDLKCKPHELTKASHVDFKKVGVML